MIIDEMASQDAAFGTENNEKKEDLFKFDEPKETTPDSQPKVEDKEEPAESESSAEETEQKVPYTRFKKKLDELTETTSRVQMLEEELEKIREAKIETQTKDIEPDEAWKELYGDSDVAKRAFKIQTQRESEIAERVMQDTLDRIQAREREEIESLSVNENIIDENLNNLEETVGKKLSAKQEEEVLSIVDEFSPTGDDGKYITLFPFDKAYEIYELRNTKSQAPRKQARESIADLTGRSSEGETEANSSHFQPKNWDSWRHEING